MYILRAIISFTFLTLSFAKPEPPINTYIPSGPNGNGLRHTYLAPIFENGNDHHFGNGHNLHTTPELTLSHIYGSHHGIGNGNGNGYGSLKSLYGAPKTAYGVPHGYGYGEAAAPAKYEFEYQVEDNEAGLDFGHREAREGDVAVGEYNVVLPDGRKQIVQYIADSEGYKPTITYEEGYGGYPSHGGYSNGGYSVHGSDN